MSMIDPMTGLNTPLSYLGNRPVLSGFPVPGVQSAPPISALNFGGPTGLAGRVAPGAGQEAMSAISQLYRAPAGATGLAGRVPIGAGQEAMNLAGQLYAGGRGAGSGAGRLAGLGARLVANPEASGLARFAAPGMTLGKAAGRLGMGAFAGQIGSGLIDKTNIGGQNSNLEQGLQGAALGAGIGAGVGAIGGPLAPITAPVGALIGGGIGAVGGVISNMLGGDNGKKDALAQIDAALSPKGRQELYALGGLDTNTKAQLERGIHLQLKLLERQRDTLSDDEYNQARAQLAASVEQAVVSYASNPTSSPASAMPTPAQMSPQDIASMQMSIGQFMQPYVDDTKAAGEQGANALRALGAGPQADLAQSGATRLANAYAAQAQMIPMMGQLQQAQSQWAQFAQQQQAQQMAGGGGAGGFDQLLAQLGASEGQQ